MCSCCAERLHIRRNLFAAFPHPSLIHPVASDRRRHRGGHTAGMPDPAVIIMLAKLDSYSYPYKTAYRSGLLTDRTGWCCAQHATGAPYLIFEFTDHDAAVSERRAVVMGCVGATLRLAVPCAVQREGTRSHPAWRDNIITRSP